MNETLKKCLDKLEKKNIKYYLAKDSEELYTGITLADADEFINFCVANEIKNVFYSNSPDNSSFQLFTIWNSYEIGYKHGIMQEEDDEDLPRHIPFNNSDSQSLTKLKELLENKDKLKEELSDYFIEHSSIKQGKKNISYYNNAIQFLNRIKNIDTAYLYSSNEYDEFWQLSKKIAEDLQRKIDDDYMNSIWSFLDNCVEKYIKKGKITKGEVSLFFSENNIIASGSIKDIFQAKVNELIQKKV